MSRDQDLSSRGVQSPRALSIALHCSAVIVWIAFIRTKAGWRGAARIAVSSSAREQFSALGQFGATIPHGYTILNQSTSQIFDDLLPQNFCHLL